MNKNETQFRHFNQRFLIGIIICSWYNCLKFTTVKYYALFFKIMLKLTIFAKGSDYWGLFSETEIGYLRWLTKGNRYKSDSIWWPTCFFLEPLLSCKRSPVMAGLAGTIQTALMFSGSKWAATKCCPALLKKKQKEKKRTTLVWSSDRSEHCSVSTPKHPGCIKETNVASLNIENTRLFFL